MRTYYCIEIVAGHKFPVAFKFTDYSATDLGKLIQET